MLVDHNSGRCSFASPGCVWFAVPAVLVLCVHDLRTEPHNVNHTSDHVEGFWQ